MKEIVKFSKEEKAEIIDKIIKYFYNEKDEEIGELAANLLLDFISENIASYYFNHGVRESIRFIQERVEDMYSLEKM